MSEILPSPQHGFRNTRIQKALKVDMTPMVDLGFLLITFFIITTSLAEQKSTALVMPAEGPPMKLPATTALTVLLTASNQVIVYEGEFKNALANHQIITTTYSTYSGLGTVIRQQQNKLSVTGKKADMMLLIKPADEATYQNMMDALDEVQINNIKHYAIVSPDKEELQFITNSKL